MKILESAQFMWYLIVNGEMHDLLSFAWIWKAKSIYSMIKFEDLKSEQVLVIFF